MDLTAFLNITLLFNYDTSLSSFITQILSITCKRKDLFNYITDYSSPSLDQYITNSLLNKMVYSYSFHGFTNEHNIDTIVVASDHNTLKLLLTKKSFKPHKLILIFYDGADINLINLSTLASTGVNLLLCQIFRNNTAALSYLNDDVALGGWSYKNDSWVTQKAATIINWKPGFKEFTTTCFDCPPYFYVRNDTVHDGTEYMIIETIGSKWNTQYITDSNGYDMYEVAKSNVRESISDVGACSQWLTGAKDSCEHSVPYGTVCVTFLVPKPYHLPYYTYVFQPLHIYSLLALIATVFLLGVIFWLISITYRVALKRQSKSLDLLTCIILYSLQLTMQGTSNRTDSNRAVRILMIATSTFALFVLTAYTAGYAVILTKTRFSKPINTLDDMLELDLHWGSTSWNIVDLFNANTTIDNKLKESFVLIEQLSDREEWIKQNKYAVLVKKLSKYYLSDTESLSKYGRENLKVLSDCVSSYATVFIFKENSPYTQIFDTWIQRFIEYGFIQHWYDTMLLNHNIQYMRNFFGPYTTEMDDQPLTYAKMEGALMLLCAGHTTATVVFLFEYIRKIKNNLQ